MGRPRAARAGIRPVSVGRVKAQANNAAPDQQQQTEPADGLDGDKQRFCHWIFSVPASGERGIPAAFAYYSTPDQA
jgi:hypothetical protein